MLASGSAVGNGWTRARSTGRPWTLRFSGASGCPSICGRRMISNAKGDVAAMRARITVVTSVVVGALALASPAVAQTEDPTQTAYGGVLAEVVTPSNDDAGPGPSQQVAAEQAAPTAAANPASADEGSLPFTGLQA